jgi:hypothetical protein
MRGGPHRVVRALDGAREKQALSNTLVRLRLSLLISGSVVWIGHGHGYRGLVNTARSRTMDSLKRWGAVNSSTWSPQSMKGRTSWLRLG